MIRILALFAFATPLIALEPAEVAVVVNRALPTSVELGEYYLKARGIPAENLIPLVLGRTEDTTRDEYDKFLAEPLREKLAARKDAIKCLLLMPGVPLRVGAKVPTDAEKAQVETLKPLLEKAKADPTQRAEAAKLQTQIMVLSQQESTASVDGELMLLWHPPYALARWQLNPKHWQAGAQLKAVKAPTLFVTRIDGPDPAMHKRMIDDAIEIEKAGLKGTVVIDARGTAFDAKQPSENGGYGYGGYDQSMRETATLFQDAKWKVILDDKPDVISTKVADDIAIYCGWYSHAKYVPVGTFAKGAIAWHLASSEAVTLHNRDSTLWCPNLLKAGVTATLGPVSEPYTVGFPKPAEFFGFLATGDCLAEAYGKSVTFTSWMMTCVGDPLYTPFKKNPLKLEVKPSPAGGRSLYQP